ncbi:MAG: DUF6597 domain-containing transcriptional factor [Bdellovibrionales bacterium]
MTGIELRTVSQVYRTFKGRCDFMKIDYGKEQVGTSVENRLVTPTFQAYVPQPPLSDFVELFWYWNHNPPKFKERILPGGSVEFVIRLTKDRTNVFQLKCLERPKSCSGAIITGPHSEFFVLDKSEQDELMGVHFKPGGSFPFFAAPANKFLNDHVSLDAVWGHEAGFLRSELLDAPTADSKFRVLERHLIKRAKNSIGRHPAVAYALKGLNRRPFPSSLSELANDVNLSPKRLTQLFTREVGVTPKLFARIQRFQEVIKLISKQNSVDWSSLALDCGYYDQAHFNHDFQEFSGINPTTYMKKKTEHLGHVPL